MKQGRLLKLVNNTPYDWIRTDNLSREIITWNLPDRIKTNTTAFIYVEWEPEIIQYQGENVGVSTYSLEGTTDTFQVQASGDEKHAILLVYCENITAKDIPKGEILPLDLSPEEDAVFILSGVHGNYYIIDVDETRLKEESETVYEDSDIIKGVGLLESEYNIVNAYWEDVTQNSSYIRNLYFPGDKKWETCLVEVRGIKSIQRFSIMIKAGEEVIANEKFSLRKDEIRIIERNIHNACSVDVTGQLMVSGAWSAGGSIYVTCIFNPDVQYKSESISWRGVTDVISSIDNLCLYGNQTWEKCEVHIESYENRDTGCMFTLISNGEIHKAGRIDWQELKGTESRTISFEINNKVPLVVAGYISNTAIIGAGASITLTGFYI